MMMMMMMMSEITLNISNPQWATAKYQTDLWISNSIQNMCSNIVKLLNLPQ